MMKGLALAGAALLGAAPASAAVLWDRVETGMSAAAVRALYPAGERVRHRSDRITIREHQVSAECSAEVRIHHEGGSVDRVEMRGEPAIAGHCSAAILESLAGRYGQPRSEVLVRAGLTTRERTVYTWERDGVFLRFVRYSSAGFGGSGLGNASWVLTYSTRADEVSL